MAEEYGNRSGKGSEYRNTADVVRRYGFNFRKRFGQNFLTDSGVLREIVSASEIGREDLVIEIGPGIGTLTRYLAEAAGQVAAIEIDRDLVKILGDTLSDCGNVRVIEGDVLKTDLSALAREYGIGSAEEPAALSPLRHLKIVANLPYYITTPILMGLFEKQVPAERITVMVQKEVAERMTAECGSRDYGSLTLAVSYYSKPEIVTVVPASSFMPSPKVDSAVVTMEVYHKDERPVTVRDEALFKAIVRATFSQRRKTLANSLGNAPGIPASREEIADALGKMGLSPSVRGEKLTLEQFAQLCDLLSK